MLNTTSLKSNKETLATPVFITNPSLRILAIKSLYHQEIYHYQRLYMPTKVMDKQGQQPIPTNVGGELSPTHTNFSSLTGEATAVTDNSNGSLQSKYDDLFRQHEELKEKLKGVHDTARRKKSGWRAKNGQKVVLSELTGEMKENAKEIAVCIKMIFYEEYKFLPMGYEVFSTDVDTFSGVIMPKMHIKQTMEKEGLDEKEIWKTYIVKILALKYTNERNQCLQSMRSRFMSEYIFFATMKSF